MNRETQHMAIAHFRAVVQRSTSRRAPIGPALLAGLISGLWIGAAQAQPVQPAATQSTTPALTYQSAFTRYKPYADQAIAPWREVNDDVGRIGGWRVYAREAQQPTATEPPRAANESAGRPGNKP